MVIKRPFLATIFTVPLTFQERCKEFLRTTGGTPLGTAAFFFQGSLQSYNDSKMIRLTSQLHKRHMHKLCINVNAPAE